MVSQSSRVGGATLAAGAERRFATARRLLSGAAAGAISTVFFAALHELLISDIWNTLVPMLIAAALCGVCLVWSYSRLFDAPRVASWMGYNLLFVGLLGLLGIVSLVVYEPVMTIPEVLTDDGKRNELIRLAMPLSVTFILASTAGIWWLFGRSLLDGAAILLTCTVLIALLGLNVSVLGLVHLTSGIGYLLALFFGLILALDLVFAAAFVGLEWRYFRPRT